MAAKSKMNSTLRDSKMSSIFSFTGQAEHFLELMTWVAFDFYYLCVSSFPGKLVEPAVVVKHVVWGQSD